MKTNRAPLYEALLRHRERQSVSFHVPGHKNGEVFQKEAADYFQTVLQLDVTELRGLDDLHEPESVIAEAQQLLAESYGAAHSYFLVGGSTAGNLAMILASCGHGDTILVQRNCHKSVIHGIKLAGARPVFLSPQIDRRSMIATGLTEKVVVEAIHQYPEAKALFLTNPNYYGMSVDLKMLIQTAHEHEVPVLVDEAHGAHFGMDPSFPASALAQGADVVVQSAHKTLPAMTMGSYLHVNSNRIDHDKIRNRLSMLQSSSPSYPVMASLDLARLYLDQLTKRDFNGIFSSISAIREQLGQLAQVSVLQSSTKAYDSLDPLKVTLQTRCSLTGYELQQRFEQEGIFTELADPYHVLFIMPLTEINEPTFFINKIDKAVSDVKEKPRENQKETLLMPQQKPLSTLALFYDQLENIKTKYLPVKDAAGCISVQEVTPYPPGIPLLFAGERIQSIHLDAIRAWHNSGARFQAGTDIFSEGVCVADIEYKGE